MKDITRDRIKDLLIPLISTLAGLLLLVVVVIYVNKNIKPQHSCEELTNTVCVIFTECGSFPSERMCRNELKEERFCDLMSTQNPDLIETCRQDLLKISSCDVLPDSCKLLGKPTIEEE